MIADTPNALITYRGEIPPEIQAALGPLIERFRCLLPDWLHHLNVAFYTSPPKDSERALAQTTSEPEYRVAYLDIFPGFMMYHDDKRVENLVHELIHVTVNPLYNTMLGFIEELFKLESLKDNAALKAVMLNGLRCVNESVTTDLQKIVCGLMDARQRELLPASAVAVPASG